MKRFIRRIALVLTALLPLAMVLNASATAGVIYEQPFFQATELGPFSDVENQQQLADEFTLDQDGTIRDVHWFGTFFEGDLPSGTTSVDFQIRFFSEAGSLPALNPFFEEVVSAGVMDTGQLVTDSFLTGDRILYEFWADITPVPVAGGITTWISIREFEQNGLLFRWANSTVETGDFNASRQTGDGTNWFQQFGERAQSAFSLTDTGQGAAVPEPSTLVLWSLGAVTLVAIGWRRRKWAA